MPAGEMREWLELGKELVRDAAENTEEIERAMCTLEETGDADDLVHATALAICRRYADGRCNRQISNKWECLNRSFHANYCGACAVEEGGGGVG